MKFSVGDKVKYIDDIGGGTIVAIQDQETVILLRDDGFEVPVNANELMPVSVEQTKQSSSSSPATHSVSSPPAQEKKFKPLPPTPQHYSEINILLALVPAGAFLETADLSVYIINDSQYDIHFQLSACFGRNYQLLEAPVLEAGTQIKLTTFDRVTFHQITHFLFQGFIVLSQFKTPYPIIEKEIPIKHKRFLNTASFKKSSYFQVPTIEYQLFHYDFHKEIAHTSPQTYQQVIKEKDLEAVSPDIYRKKTLVSQDIEVDLHIEKLTDHYKQMSNAEMLATQLEHFQKELDAAIARQAERIIFIHGVGKGRLKQEIIKKLKQEYPKLTYQDASFKKYGFGATMVFLR